MGTSAKGETLGAHVRHEIVAEVKARGAALSMKKGTYTAHILEWWWHIGCPPVTPADEAMQALKKKPPQKKLG